MTESRLIQIDVRQALASKLGAKARFVPGWAIRWLERTICQDAMNEKLRLYYPLEGAAFCEAAVQDFGNDVRVVHPERLPEPAARRVIFVSNHPLGGFDGIVLIAELARRYGEGVRFIVNDLLMALGPVAKAFLPINKHGRQSRESIEAINAAMQGPDPIVVFPAGLVSRRGKGGEIKDLQWHKMFVTKAVQSGRDVVPLFFSGQNSPHFYKVAQWRKRLGVNFNIEMLYLPREMMACQGRHFDIVVGQRIPWQQLSAMGEPLQAAQKVRDLVYDLKQEIS